MMQSVKNDAKKNLEVATDPVSLDSVETVEEVQGTKQSGMKIVASYSGNVYYIKPCPLSKIPELVGYIKELETSMAKQSSPTEVLISDDGKVLKQMAKVIKLALMRDNQSKTVESVMDEFTLGDFPKIYKCVLDINDFLAGMRNIYQTSPNEK